MSKKREKVGKKKANAALSARDKKLLTGVGIFALVVAYGFGVFNLYQKNQDLATERDTIEQEFTNKQSKINQKAALQKQHENLSADALTKAKKYYGTVNQGEFIYLIDRFIKESEISLESVSFQETKDLEFPEEGTTLDGTSSSSSSSSSTSSSSSDTSSSTSSGDTVASSSDATTTTAAVQKAEEKYQNTNITQMTANIEFKGTYTQILKLLELVDTNDKKIVSSQLNLDGEDEILTIQQTDPPLTGNILLRFYQVEDVERYVTPTQPEIDKVDIGFQATVSPFMWPEWRGQFVGANTGGTSNQSTATNNVSNLSTPSVSDTAGLGGSGLAPQYLNQLQNQNTGGSNLSAYFNSSTVYKFDTPLQLVRTSDGHAVEVGVDNTDFKEGAGSNVIAIPASTEAAHYEMLFADPGVTLNTQPSNISFAMSTASKWSGKIGLIVENASGQNIYVEIVMPDSWSGWREVSFAPTNISGLSYPLKIKGFYFETPSGASDGTTLKLDNLSIHQLVTN